MNAENLLAALDVRLVDEHLPIEASRAEQGRIEHLGTIRRAHDDDALARIEAVHLRQELIERLLAFLVAAERALHAHLAERVELVDEDDARRLAFGLLEQVADAGRADAHEHLDEFRSAEAEKRHVRLAGDGAREQRLARAGRTDEQHALGNPPAEVRVLFRILEELDDLLQFVLGFVHAGDVREPHFDFVVRIDLGAAPGERHHAALGAAHAPEEEAPDGDEEDGGNDPAEEIGHPSVGDLARVLHAFAFKLLDELRIFDAGRHELGRRLRIAGGKRLFERASDDLLGNRDLDHLTVLHQPLELAVRNRAALRRHEVQLREPEHEQEREPVPEGGTRALDRRTRPAAIAAARIAGGLLR